MTVDQRDIVNPEFPLRHDPEKLADALMAIGREHLTDVAQRPAELRRGYAIAESERVRVGAA